MRFLLVISLLGCAGAPPPEPKNSADETPSVVAPPAPEPPDPIERSDRRAVELAIQVVGEMAEAAANTAGMCAEQGAELSAIVGANGDLWEQLSAIAGDQDRAPILEAQREGLETALAALLEQVQPCGNDPSVRAALAGMAH